MTISRFSKRNQARVAQSNAQKKKRAQHLTCRPFLKQFLAQIESFRVRQMSGCSDKARNFPASADLCDADGN